MGGGSAVLWGSDELPEALDVLLMSKPSQRLQRPRGTGGLGRPWGWPGSAPSRCWWLEPQSGSPQQGIDHLHARNPAPVAEVFRIKNVAVAADRGLGDQGIEPAELLPNRQLVGIEDQIGIGT